MSEKVTGLEVGERCKLPRDESTGPEPGKKKLKRNPAVAKAMFGPKTPQCRTMSIPVKLEPRVVSADVFTTIQNHVETVSKIAVLASRFANWIASHRPMVDAFTFSSGQSFYGQVISTVILGKSGRGKLPLVSQEEWDAFVESVGNVNIPCFHGFSSCLMESTRNEMAKDAIRSIRVRMWNKVPLYIRHNLRKYGCRIESMSLSGSKQVVYKLSNVIFKQVRLDQPLDDSVVSELTPNATLEESQRAHEAFRSVWELSRGLLQPVVQGGHDVIERINARPRGNGDKRKPLVDPFAASVNMDKTKLHLCIPVLRQIGAEFLKDSQARSEICHTLAGKALKAERGAALKKLAAWERECPGSFHILPYKPRAVNFVHVDRSTARRLFPTLLPVDPSRDITMDAFWWTKLFDVDDARDGLWRRLADCSPFLDAKAVRKIMYESGIESSRDKRRFRRNQHAGKRQGLPSRIPGLAVSYQHLRALRRMDFSALILTGFKTNGYELHLEGSRGSR